MNNALNLNERAALADTSSGSTAVNSDLIARWTKQPPFQNPEIFSARLKAAGLSENCFQKAISLRLPDASTDDTKQNKIHIEADWREILDSVQPFRAEHIEAFSYIVGPRLAAAYERIHHKSKALGHCLLSDPGHISKIMFSYISGATARMSQRCLLRELHAERKNGTLDKGSSKKNLQYFFELLAEQQYSEEILGRYPVLERQLETAISQWERSSIEILDRLQNDHASLGCKFGGTTPIGSLTDISLEVGDNHGGGRSVAILTFSSDVKIVYKPRSMNIDQAYIDFLDWMQQEGFPIDMKAAQVVKRKDYGWAEFIEQQPCTNKLGAKRFFERQGVLIAILYLFSGSDFHHENLIAAADYPILIDLETFLQPDASLNGLVRGAATPGNDIYKTVLVPGLLPSRVWSGGGAGSKGVDLSGMAAGEQLSPIAGWVLENGGTDQMRLVKKRVPMPVGNHMASVDGLQLTPEKYSQEILHGFSTAYRFFQLNKTSLVNANGPLSGFEKVEVRVILRDTYYYALLLSDAYHPDLLNDALERDLYFDRLWLEAVKCPVFAQVIEAERYDFWQNDIPCFSTIASAKNLLTSTKNTIENFWPKSAMETLKSKINQLSKLDEDRQIWLVEKTLSSLSPETAVRGFDAYIVKEKESENYKKDTLTEAKKIANRLIDLSFCSEDKSYSWMTCTPNKSAQWGYEQTGIDLYDGTAGISLFFAQMHQHTGKKEYDEAARGAWQTVLHALKASPKTISSPGAYSGWGSLLYTAQHLDALWPDSYALDTIMNLLPSAGKLINGDKEFDLIGGSAGFIILATNLIHTGDFKLLGYAVALGDYLLEVYQETEVGVGWHLEAAGNTPLGGFSHGTAGIAWALLRLTAVTGDNKYEAVALRALDYDRSLYSPEEKNWLDLRDGYRPGEAEQCDKNFVMAWCHGAPGIGFSRLLMRNHLHDEFLEEEIKIAAEKTLTSGFGKNHSLCHGDLGNLEFLITTAKQLADTKLEARCDRLAAGILESAKQNRGWLCGYPPNTEPLGLMVGLAGIGYGLLKLAKWDEVPSVLTLEPPTKQKIIDG